MAELLFYNNQQQKIFNFEWNSLQADKDITCYYLSFLLLTFWFTSSTGSWRLRDGHRTSDLSSLFFFFLCWRPPPSHFCFDFPHFPFRHSKKKRIKTKVLVQSNGPTRDKRHHLLPCGDSGWYIFQWGASISASVRLFSFQNGDDPPTQKQLRRLPTALFLCVCLL